jgi:predicted RNA-binding protein with PUA-like domain
MNYWLIKSEGDCYSINDLKRDKKSAWTGVRNFQARNFMRDSMKIGDGVLYYHSNGKKENPTGVYGLAKVASKPYMDETQFDKKDDHYDPKSKKENPTWILIDMSFVKKFKNIVTLNQIKFEPKLQGIMVAQAGSLLSIQPVSKDHFEFIINMGH